MDSARVELHGAFEFSTPSDGFGVALSAVMILGIVISYKLRNNESIEVLASVVAAELIILIIVMGCIFCQFLVDVSFDIANYILNGVGLNKMPDGLFLVPITKL